MKHTVYNILYVTYSRDPSLGSSWCQAFFTWAHELAPSGAWIPDIQLVLTAPYCIPIWPAHSRVVHFAFTFKTKFGKEWLIAALVAYLGERKHNFKSKIWSNSGTASKIDYYLVLRIVKGPVRGSHKGWKCRNQCRTIGEVTANTSFIIPFLLFWFRSELQT